MLFLILSYKTFSSRPPNRNYLFALQLKDTKLQFKILFSSWCIFNCSFHYPLTYKLTAWLTLNPHRCLSRQCRWLATSITWYAYNALHEQHGHFDHKCADEVLMNLTIPGAYLDYFQSAKPVILSQGSMWYIINVFMARQCATFHLSHGQIAQVAVALWYGQLPGPASQNGYHKVDQNSFRICLSTRKTNIMNCPPFDSQKSEVSVLHITKHLFQWILSSLCPEFNECLTQVNGLWPTNGGIIGM